MLALAFDVPVMPVSVIVLIAGPVKLLPAITFPLKTLGISKPSILILPKPPACFDWDILLVFNAP